MGIGGLSLSLTMTITNANGLVHASPLSTAGTELASISMQLHVR